MNMQVRSPVRWAPSRRVQYVGVRSSILRYNTQPWRTKTFHRLAKPSQPSSPGLSTLQLRLQRRENGRSNSSKQQTSNNKQPLHKHGYRTRQKKPSHPIKRQTTSHPIPPHLVRVAAAVVRVHLPPLAVHVPPSHRRGRRGLPVPPHTPVAHAPPVAERRSTVWRHHPHPHPALGSVSLLHVGELHHQGPGGPLWARHVTAQNGTARHSTAQRGAGCGTACHGTSGGAGGAGGARKKKQASSRAAPCRCHTPQTSSCGRLAVVPHPVARYAGT